MKNEKDLKILLGKLWEVYCRKDVWEILIDSFDCVYYVDREGMKDIKIFENHNELLVFVENLKKYSEIKTKEVVNFFVRLDELSFCHVVMPPIAIKGPAITIMKLPEKEVTFDDLIKWEALSQKGKDKILEILHSNKGFIVAGNVGSGKTTLLNTIINAIPIQNRVVTIERTPNLVLKRKYICRLQSLTQTKEEIIDIISAVENLRADYAILTDAIGGEIFSFIEMVRNNCSAGGILLTGDSPMDTIKRLETKVVLASEGYNFEEARYAIAQAMPYLIFQERREDGKREISSIHEIKFESGELKLKLIYKP